MVITFDTLPAAAVQANTRPRQSPSRLCRPAAAVVATIVAMHAHAVADEAPSVASFAIPAVAGAPSSPGGPARAKHDRPALNTKDARETAASDVHLKFFGFLEFDWNSPGSGGVPGFGPLPDSPSHVVLADTSQ